MGERSPDGRAARPRRAWNAASRVVLGLAGLLLLEVFARAAFLLPTASGAALALEFAVLIGGIVLVGTALFPFPARVRGILAWIAGVVAVGLVAALFDGFHGWRRLAVGAAFSALPGALLLRARADSWRPRLLVGASAALTLLLYLVPVEGVVPIRAALGLLTSGSLAAVLTSLVFLAPLALTLLALTAFSRSFSWGLAVLAALLLGTSAPGGLIAAGFGASDVWLIHLGLVLLAGGAAAALGLADALAGEPRS